MIANPWGIEGMTIGAAIVTGAAGDIGQAIARRLLADHAAVVLADHDERGLVEVAAALGPRAHAVVADVTSERDAGRVAGMAAALAPLRTLVNNAGAARGDSLAATDPAGWDADLTLNLTAPWLMFRACAPHLAGGSVVNIASVNGIGVFGHPAYSAAKAGMIHLTRLIAVEYGHLGIRANTVAPGTVRTRAWAARAAANPAVFAEAAAHYPLGRIATPEDVAEAVGFLASPLAGAITGACLPVDAGLTAGTPALARTFTQSDDYRSV